jgi:acetate kinase
MVKILVINSGSSSLKYTLFEMKSETELFSGSIERIGLNHGTHSFRDESSGTTQSSNVYVENHGEALDMMLETLFKSGLHRIEEISAVAHRVGHGGNYKVATPVDEGVKQEIRRMTPMIPLHHPAMLKEIEESMIRMPNALHVAVFDTSFHRTIPDYAAIYGLPYRYFDERGYRKTGFHGHSHDYVSSKAAEFLSTPIENLNIISCHLGNGASITAIQGGRSIDTTLGMTAVEGLIMGTRAGDVDPGLLPIIMKEDSLTPDQTIQMLSRESGLLGISGISPDMREVETAAQDGNKRASLCFNAFCYKVKRYIGAMMAVMGGCDVLIFTGGIGRNSNSVRSRAVEGMAGLGFMIDESLNSGPDRSTGDKPVVDISHPDSRVKILVIRTSEEIMMARECLSVYHQHSCAGGCSR